MTCFHFADFFPLHHSTYKMGPKNGAVGYTCFFPLWQKKTSTHKITGTHTPNTNTAGRKALYVLKVTKLHFFPKYFLSSFVWQKLLVYSVKELFFGRGRGGGIGLMVVFFFVAFFASWSCELLFYGEGGVKKGDINSPSMFLFFFFLANNLREIVGFSISIKELSWTFFHCHSGKNDGGGLLFFFSCPFKF